MTKLRNAIIIIILIAVVGGYFGTKFWNSMYKKPRDANAKKKQELEEQIAKGEKNLALMGQFTKNNMTLFTRSFPLNEMGAKTEYQLWLTQFAQYCRMDSPVITGGNSTRTNGLRTLPFRLHARCTMTQLYRFLYEFYWSPFLHRITMMDILPEENSNMLVITIMIEGLTMPKGSPTWSFPLASQLPATTVPYRRLTSGTFPAYSPVAERELFRYTPPGIDTASYVILTGIPFVSDPKTEKAVAQTRWKIETENKTITCGIGDRLNIGSFDGTIHDIHDDIVILKQNSGALWLVALGDKLSDAVAIPENLQ